MNKDTKGLFSESIDVDNQTLYEYVYQCSTNNPPETVIKEFKNLLLQGRNNNPKASHALEKIIFAAGGQKQFGQALSHCFYLILNSWSTNPEYFAHIQELIAIIATVSKSSSYDRRRKQLILLIKEYIQTKPYYQLQAVVSFINYQVLDKLAQQKVVTNEVDNTDFDLSTSLINNHLPRYTYLYSYFLPQDDELKQLTEYIRKLQNQRQKDFEIQLSKHMIYRFRLKQLAKMKLMSKGAGKIITKVNNPTLLSEKAFRVAVKQYLGKREGNKTLLERSQRFNADHDSRNSYQGFKTDLYLFLIDDIKPRDQSQNFADSLKSKLDNVFPQSNSKALNNTLILQTCRQLYSFIVIDPNSTKDNNKFASLIVHLGTAQVMVILLKLVLICPDSKPDLEKKIALIGAQHQLNPIQDIPWLFKSLEHLLMAFSLYFGDIDILFPSS